MKRHVFWICLTVFMTLAIVGFILPPPGQVDDSVLKIGGIAFGFAALDVIYIAIMKGIDAKVVHKDTMVEITQHDEDND